ncbi:MAG: crosslink repair DNA glycosylase YcaQ family protein [Micropruina glycogenica]
MRFTDDARRARLARRHALHPGHRLTSVVDVARALVGLHATEPSSVHLAVAARMPSATVSTVEDALYEQRSVVKQLAMRRTLFAFPREVLPAVWGSVSARVADAERGKLARDLEHHDVADEGAAWIDRGRDAVLVGLAGGYALSAKRLRELPAIDGRSSPAVEGARSGGWATCRSRHGCSPCWGRTRIVRGATRALATSRPAWTLMDGLARRGTRRPARRSGLRRVGAALAVRLRPRHRGRPGGWLGSTKAAVRAALRAVEAVPVTSTRATGYVLPGDEATR